jgi:hypothetical protein
MRWRFTGFERLPAWLRSPYFWITVGALVWMGFLDAYNWVEQARLARRLDQMRQQLAFYEREIGLLREEEISLTTDPYTQEWYARQHYWVKKSSEKLFILQPKAASP